MEQETSNGTKKDKLWGALIERNQPLAALTYLKEKGVEPCDLAVYFDVPVKQINAILRRNHNAAEINAFREAVDASVGIAEARKAAEADQRGEIGRKVDEAYAAAIAINREYETRVIEDDYKGGGMKYIHSILFDQILAKHGINNRKTFFANARPEWFSDTLKDPHSTVIRIDGENQRCVPLVILPGHAVSPKRSAWDSPIEPAKSRPSAQEEPAPFDESVYEDYAKPVQPAQ